MLDSSTLNSLFSWRPIMMKVMIIRPKVIKNYRSSMNIKLTMMISSPSFWVPCNLKIMMMVYKKVVHDMRT
jgi:hypothetical protein